MLTISKLFSASAQDSACFVKKDFLIIQSTRNYKEALQTAQQASKSLGIKFDLRQLVPDNDTLVGLTLPPDSCNKIIKEYDDPDVICYYARGRWDDGVYISIEYSNAYSEFKKGYYIVMVGSGSMKEQNLSVVLKKVKSKYPDAYIKTSKVYMCCMH